MTTPANIAEIINFLHTAHRIGAAEDKPEGVRYIQISDTLALSLAGWLEELPDPQVNAGDLNALTSAVQDLTRAIDKQAKQYQPQAGGQ